MTEKSPTPRPRRWGKLTPSRATYLAIGRATEDGLVHAFYRAVDISKDAPALMLSEAQYALCDSNLHLDRTLHEADLQTGAAICPSCFTDLVATTNDIGATIFPWS